MSPDSKLRHVAETPLRLVRSRGFGVHSPFAFAFITGVLRRRYRYYAYPQLRRLARGSRIKASTLMLLFRVAARFNPAQAACFGPHATLFDATLRLVRADIGLCSLSPAMVAADGPAPGLDDAIGACIDAGGVIFIDRLNDRRSLTRPVWDEAVARLGSRGMTFSNGRTGIIVAAPHLPRQDFKVWL